MHARSPFCVCAAMLCVALACHVGAGSARATGPAQPGEVAVLSGELPDGGTIPLPVYSDGVQATDAECRWIVSPRTFLVQYSGHVYCYATGRVVRVVSEGGLNDPATVANYMIVAVRSQAPTPAQRSTVGGVKVRYR